MAWFNSTFNDVAQQNYLFSSDLWLSFFDEIKSWNHFDVYWGVNVFFFDHILFQIIKLRILITLFCLLKSILRELILVLSFVYRVNPSSHHDFILIVLSFSARIDWAKVSRVYAAQEKWLLIILYFWREWRPIKKCRNL